MQRNYLGVPITTWRKCLNEQEQADICLREGKISFLLTEELNSEDVSSIETAVKNGKEQLKSVKDYIASMSIAQSLLGVSGYLEKLDNALTQAEEVLGRSNFEVGLDDKAKVSLKKTARVSLQVYAMATDFSQGFTKTVKNIQSNLLPLIKNAKEDATLQSVSGKGNVPDDKRLKAGFVKAFTMAFSPRKQGFLQKISGWFKDSNEKSILQKLQNHDPKTLADTTANAFLSAKIKDFKIQIKSVNPDADTSLSSAVKDVAQQGDQKNTENVPKEAAGDVMAMAKKELGLAGGKGEISKAELAKMLKAYPDIVGGGPKANKARAAFRKAVNAAAGKKVFEEALLISGRVKQKEEDTNDAEVQRWKQLAGIK